MQFHSFSAGILLRLNVNRHAVWEIFLFILLALLFDQLLFSGDRYWSVSPHPFWLLIVLICVQYGTNEGLLAAAASSAGLLLFNLPPQALQQDLFSYTFMLSERPLMWLVAAVVIGELQSRKNQELLDKEAELEAKTQELSKITQAYDRLNLTKQMLEERWAGQLNTAIALYQEIQKVETLDPPQVLSNAADLMAKVTGAKQLSIYLLDSDQLRQVASHGEPSGAATYDSSCALFHAVVLQRRSLVANRADDRVLLDGGAAIVCPITGKEQGRVMGMLKLNQIPFLQLNWMTLKTVEVMAEWIAAVLVNAERFQLAERERLTRDSGIYSGRFYRQHCEFVKDLARRIGFDVTLVRIKLSCVGEGSRNHAIKLLLQGVQSCLRRNDLLFDIRDNGEEFALVLTDTSLPAWSVVEQKLEQTLCQLRTQHQLEFKIESHCEWLYQYDPAIIT